MKWGSAEVDHGPRTWDSGFALARLCQPGLGIELHTPKRILPRVPRCQPGDFPLKKSGGMAAASRVSYQSRRQISGLVSYSKGSRLAARRYQGH